MRAIAILYTLLITLPFYWSEPSQFDVLAMPTMQAADVTILEGGTLIDGTGNDPLEDAVIVIEGTRIVAVGRQGEVNYPDGAETVNIDGKFVMPGLIDAHYHVQSEATLKAYLRSGVTTVFSAADWKDNILEMRRKEKAGQIESPRIFAVGPMFTAPGGMPIPLVGGAIEYVQVKELEAARAEVRKLASDGVDGIKVVYDDWFGQFPMLTYEQMEGIIDEAHRNGLKAYVHIWNLAQAKDAVEAGADVLMHGAIDNIDDEFVKMMKDNEVIYVPTLAIQEGPKPAQDNVKRLYSAGVVVAFGTDAKNAISELWYMSSSGLSPMQVIVAATKNSAMSIGVDDTLGTIEEGKLADIIVLDSDPLEEITNVGKIYMVIKNGRIVYAKVKIGIRPRSKLAHTWGEIRRAE